jgi:hypothetical protein
VVVQNNSDLCQAIKEMPPFEQLLVILPKIFCDMHTTENGSKITTLHNHLIPLLPLSQ